MNALMHLVLKDVRRMLPALLVWLLMQLLLLEEAVRFLHFPAQGYERFGFSFMVMSAGSLFWMLLSLLLTVSLLREDPLVDSSAFWVTRPISGLRLLSAKVLGILICVLLPPALIAFPLWLAEGMTLAWICEVAARVAFVQCGFVLLGLLSAFFSRRNSSMLSHILGYTLFLGLGYFALMKLLIGPDAYFQKISPPLANARLTLSVLCLLGGVLLALGYLFCRRSRLGSLAIGLVTLVLASAIILFWPWVLAGGDRPKIKAGDLVYFADRYGQTLRCEGPVSGLRETEFLMPNGVTERGENYSVDKPADYFLGSLHLDREAALQSALFGPPAEHQARKVMLSFGAQGRPLAMPVDKSVFLATQTQALSCPEVSIKVLSRLHEYVNCGILSLAEGDFVTRREGSLFVEKVSRLDAGRIEVQVSEVMASDSVFGQGQFYIIDPDSGAKYLLPSAAEPRSYRTHGVVLMRRRFAFTLQNIGLSGVHGNEAVSKALRACRLVKVVDVPGPLLERTVHAPAMPLTIEPPSAEMRQRYLQKLQSLPKIEKSEITNPKTP